MPCQDLFYNLQKPSPYAPGTPDKPAHKPHLQTTAHTANAPPAPKLLPYPFAAQKTAHQTPEPRLFRAVLDLKAPLPTPDSKPATQPLHLNSRHPNPPPSESASLSHLNPSIHPRIRPNAESPDTQILGPTGKSASSARQIIALARRAETRRSHRSTAENDKIREPIAAPPENLHPKLSFAYAYSTISKTNLPLRIGKIKHGQEKSKPLDRG